MPAPSTDFAFLDGQELVMYEPVGESAIENVPALRRQMTQSRQRNV
jgi:hypothetical protein